MWRWYKWIGALLFLILSATGGQAQQSNIYWRSGTGINPFNPVTTANPLPVNVVSGGFSGATSNASSGVATSSTNAPTVAYNYVFNGATWDQLSSLTLGSVHAPTVAIVDASGNQITSFGGASNITQWASVVLGAPSAYGTSPGTVNVPGVNANVTSLPPPNAPNATLVTWTSATAGNTNVDIASSAQYPFVQITLDNGVVSTGAVTFRGKKANGSYENLAVTQVLNKQTCAPLTNAYALPIGGATGAAAQDFLISNVGYQTINVDLTTAITGAGTLVVTYTLVPYAALDQCILNPVIVTQSTAANLNATVVGTGTFAAQAALTAAATGGCTPGVILSAANNNSALVGAAGARTLCELTILNTTTSLVSVRLYDVGSAPTCSSATGVVGNYVQQSNAVSPGMAVPLGPFGKAFTSGIGICITGANANNDNTNAVTGINVNYSYK